MAEPKRRIYLDNAATSFPKPESVYDAVDRYQRELGGAVGRGATQVGSEIQQTVDRCRNRVAKLLGVAKASHALFTMNGTDSLNLAIHGLLREGDHVVTTCWEHNSVLRPLDFLARSRQVETTYIGSDGSGQVDVNELKKSLSNQTRLVCITHASNVTGVVQPVEEVINIAHDAGAIVLLDAAQTVGHLSVSMSDLGADLLACPGHKGLFGPLGTGILALRPGLVSELDSIRQGGTGTTSESESQPDSLPEKYESGNHNAPGLFGLDTALNWIEKETVKKIEQHEQALTQQFIEGLKSLPEIEVYLGDESIQRVGLVSLNASRLEPQVFSSLLDQHFGIETRAGLHCAPRSHEAIGTKERGGTVRFSFGPFNTPDDVDLTLEAIGQITSAF